MGVLPVGDQASQQVGAAQERAVGRGRPPKVTWLPPPPVAGMPAVGRRGVALDRHRQEDMQAAVAGYDADGGVRDGDLRTRPIRDRLWVYLWMCCRGRIDMAIPRRDLAMEIGERRLRFDRIGLVHPFDLVIVLGRDCNGRRRPTGKSPGAKRSLRRRANTSARPRLCSPRAAVVHSGAAMSSIETKVGSPPWVRRTSRRSSLASTRLPWASICVHSSSV